MLAVYKIPKLDGWYMYSNQDGPIVAFKSSASDAQMLRGMIRVFLAAPESSELEREISTRMNDFIQTCDRLVPPLSLGFTMDKILVDDDD